MGEGSGSGGVQMGGWEALGEEGGLAGGSRASGSGRGLPARRSAGRVGQQPSSSHRERSWASRVPTHRWLWTDKPAGWLQVAAERLLLPPCNAACFSAVTPHGCRPVDPSLYIHRFADRLEFGRKMLQVGPEGTGQGACLPAWPTCLPLPQFCCLVKCSVACSSAGMRRSRHVPHLRGSSRGPVHFC